jgi:hypothetical protein
VADPGGVADPARDICYRSGVGARIHRSVAQDGKGGSITVVRHEGDCSVPDPTDGSNYMMCGLHPLAKSQAISMLSISNGTHDKLIALLRLP